jgi:hypothetical protein
MAARSVSIKFLIIKFGIYLGAVTFRRPFGATENFTPRADLVLLTEIVPKSGSVIGTGLFLGFV